LPMVLGVAMYYVSGKQPLMLLIALLTPLMVVGAFLEGLIGGGASNRRQMTRFNRRLNDLEARLAKANQGEAARRRAASPGVGLVVERAREMHPSLWERRPDHDDFLLLRLGWADLPSGSSVEVADEESERVRS